MFNGFPTRSGTPDVFEYHFRLLGANGANPTEEMGHSGVTVTRAGEGRYLFTFAFNPGRFINAAGNVGAATPANVAGYTVHPDTWDSSALTIELVVYDATQTVQDVIADQYLHATLRFTRNGFDG